MYKKISNFLEVKRFKIKNLLCLGAGYESILYGLNIKGCDYIYVIDCNSSVCEYVDYKFKTGVAVIDCSVVDRSEKSLSYYSFLNIHLDGVSEEPSLLRFFLNASIFIESEVLSKSINEIAFFSSIERCGGNLLLIDLGDLSLDIVDGISFSNLSKIDWVFILYPNYGTENQSLKSCREFLNNAGFQLELNEMLNNMYSIACFKYSLELVDFVRTKKRLDYIIFECEEYQKEINKLKDDLLLSDNKFKELEMMFSTLSKEKLKLKIDLESLRKNFYRFSS